MNKNTQILVALVEDSPGVLTRISSLFSRRRFNIISLTVGQTERKGISRMTVAVDSTSTNVEQVIKQMYKIVNVLKVSDVTKDATVIRETALVKVSATKSNRTEVLQMVEIFRAKVVDVTLDSMIVELSSHPDKINSFIELVSSFGIKELVRTGVTVMNRGKSGEIKLKQKQK